MSLKTRTWKWLLGAVALVAAAGVEGWALKKQSERVCHSAVDLAQNAEALRAWILEAEADPYLGPAAMRGPVYGVIAEFRNRSRWIQSELSARLLPEQARAAFLRLNTAGDASLPVADALQGISALKPILVCEARRPAGEEAGLARQIEGAADFWRDQKLLAENAKLEFEQDRVIFCKADELLRGLQRVAQATAGRCAQEKLPPKVKKACEGEKTGPVALEMADLEKQKEFNLKKLRQKWNDGILKGLQCS